MPEITVEAPLRGEWFALHTPAERVPSHGTDYLGQTYAFDFVQLDERHRPYQHGTWRHLLAALPANAFLCWDKAVYSVSEGHVAAVGEGWPDRRHINLFAALASASLWPPRARGSDIRPLAGNFVVVEGPGASAFYAHLQHGTVKVKVGDHVVPGTVLGRVGNSGNTTMPHLHFHLMDRPQIEDAKGVGCRFRYFERHEAGAWNAVHCGIPGVMERIRW